MKTIKYLVAFAVCGLALLMVGCHGDPMTGVYKGISTIAIAAEGCRDVLSVAHEAKTTAIAAKAASAGAAAAKPDLDKWMPTYGKIKTACVAAKVGAEAALAAAPSIEAAVTKKKDAMGWIVRLAKLGIDIATALADAGLKLPGSK